MSSPALQNPHLRLATPADLQAIVHTINAAFSVEKFFIDGDRISEAEVRTLMTKGTFLISEDNGAVAGCVYLEPRPKSCYLGLLSVDPSRQRSGIGTRLVAAAEDYARKAGFQTMELRIVNLRKELPPYYQSLGYAQTGTSPFPGDTLTKLPCYFINMSKPLDRK